MKNLIGITMGDPRGIGPEIIAKAWVGLSEEERAQIIIYGDHTALATAADLADTQFPPKQVVITSSVTPPISEISDAEAARMAISALDASLEDISANRIGAIVTGPVNKQRMRCIKPTFIGHTEYMARAAKARDTVMMFCAEEFPSTGGGPCQTKPICISLVTMHVALKDVAGQITKERILVTTRRTRQALDQYFACPQARIAVMSLNPHAGEGGAMGHEEIKIIRPAVERARREGINCEGPLSAEVIFRNIKDFNYDAVVAMYHDQGLLPIKLLCPECCVHLTLGLPYIRTSPGHGTAEDIAWMGQASEKNMLAAIRLTRRLVGWKIDYEKIDSD